MRPHLRGRSWARIFAVVSLVAGVSAVVPTIAANATVTNAIQVRWANGLIKNYACTTGQTNQGGSVVVYVDNGCSGRVWLHANTDGSGDAYCINPGAQAYSSPQSVGAGLTFPGAGYFEQASYNAANTNACDSGTRVTTNWFNGIYNQNTTGTSYPANCIQGTTYWAANPFSVPLAPPWYYLLTLTNTCNTRIWVHQNQDGTGAAYCISPAGWASDKYDATTGAAFNWEQNYGGEQIQISANQAPCYAN